VSPDLVRLFGIREGEVAAFVGGGGKSTLVLGLGRELANADRPVVMATTTKMGVDQIPVWARVCQDVAGVAMALRAGSPAYLLRRAEESKVIGVDPALVDEIAAGGKATVLVEADGSRRRPFKAPGEHEPVIPSTTTLVAVVVGIDAIGRPIAEACHRPERVAALTGRSVADPVRPQDVATVAAHPAGGRKNVPEGARLVVALTKVEPRHARLVAAVRGELAHKIDVLQIGNR
jgi:probable selenium-dependent hydroxylase accessory protein YqeC